VKKLYKNFNPSKLTVESMLDACGCGCDCGCPTSCKCTDVTNYAALSNAVLMIGYGQSTIYNNASSMAAAIG
jgi:hypothetical protein